jgi:hypothetical protein
MLSCRPQSIVSKADAVAKFGGAGPGMMAAKDCAQLASAKVGSGGVVEFDHWRYSPWNEVVQGVTAGIGKNWAGVGRRIRPSAVLALGMSSFVQEVTAGIGEVRGASAKRVSNSSIVGGVGLGNAVVQGVTAGTGNTWAGILSNSTIGGVGLGDEDIHPRSHSRHRRSVKSPPKGCRIRASALLALRMTSFKE